MRQSLTLEGMFVISSVIIYIFRDKYSKLNILELVFIFRRGSSPVENEIAIKTIFHWCLYAVYNISLYNIVLYCEIATY